MDYFKLSKQQAGIVVVCIAGLHKLKAPKRKEDGLHPAVYEVLDDLYTFLSEEPPEGIKPYLPKKKPRILTADKMFRWLEENRYKPSEFVHGLVCSPDDRVDFYQGMWPLCGGTDTGGYTWLPEWFEKEEK